MIPCDAQRFALNCIPNSRQHYYFLNISLSTRYSQNISLRTRYLLNMSFNTHYFLNISISTLYFRAVLQIGRSLVRSQLVSVIFN